MTKIIYGILIYKIVYRLIYVCKLKYIYGYMPKLINNENTFWIFFFWILKLNLNFSNQFEFYISHSTSSWLIWTVYGDLGLFIILKNSSGVRMHTITFKMMLEIEICTHSLILAMETNSLFEIIINFTRCNWMIIKQSCWWWYGHSIRRLR